MAFDRLKPYNDLPFLPPAAELESKAVLKLVIAARTALADLRGAAKLLPNQGVLIQAIENFPIWIWLIVISKIVEDVGIVIAPTAQTKFHVLQEKSPFIISRSCSSDFYIVVNPIVVCKPIFAH